MNKPAQIMARFFKVMVDGQAYLNLVYILAAFPLGILYFVFLVSGLSLGISLSIVWVGIPLLLIVGVGWLVLAKFERFITIHWLKQEVPAMEFPQPTGADIWSTFKEHFLNPVTWKSPVYLFLKFPLRQL